MLFRHHTSGKRQESAVISHVGAMLSCFLATLGCLPSLLCVRWDHEEYLLSAATDSALPAATKSLAGSGSSLPADHRGKKGTLVCRGKESDGSLEAY